MIKIGGSRQRRLEVSLGYSLGALALDLEFCLTAPWSVLFAPSGEGKSTVLRMIAGLLRPERGRVAVASGEKIERVLTDIAAGVWIAPYLRRIGFVAQEPALFPHLSVLGNVRYADRSPGKSAEVLALCRVEHLVDKMPREISGGEQQRVVLARALAATPEFLLLDEPFTGLDTDLRDGLIADLHRWLGARGTIVLQVTHDLGDVLATGAEVLVMERGRIAAQGPAGTVLRQRMDRLRTQIERV